MFSSLPTLVKYQVCLHMNIEHLLFLARWKIYKNIVKSKYFWKLRLLKDFPQYTRQEEYFENYKRLYQGHCMKFRVCSDKLDDIIFTRVEQEHELISPKNLDRLTEISLKKFTCLRGDLIIVHDAPAWGYFTCLIFDGKKLLNTNCTVVPKEFQCFVEFPLGYWDIFD